MDPTKDMASKRNSRVYSDEVTHRDQKPVATAYRSRRNSRGSIKDEKMQAAKDAEDGQVQRSDSAVRDTASASRQTNGPLSKESSSSKSSKNADATGKLTRSPRMCITCR